jgi:uncharacterized protein (TIGR02145 family)
MRKKQLKNRTIAVAAIFFVCAMNISAQVNIGTIDPPHAAAVLDLSQKEAAAPYRGLLLPRVSLNEPDEFQLIANPSDVQLSEAAGMTVYNLNECLTVSPGKGGTGIYVWSGTQWQYLGTPGVTKTATPAETTAGDTSWDTGTTPADRVVRHAAKPNPAYQNPAATPDEPVNIYEEFYSAWFGDAGRWMTTNLAAWKYDGIKHSTDTDSGNPATGGSGTPRTLTGPNANRGNPYNTAYWCYPNGGSYNNAATNPNGLGGEDPTSYDNNPHIGFLYTWDAATAGKGGSSGQLNIYNLTSTGTSANNESAREYDPLQLDGTQTTFQGNSNTGYQWRIQGICPSGWHLPSDYEWFLLEKELIRHTTYYSASVSDINPGETDDRGNTGGNNVLEIPNPGVNGTVGSRVAGLGQAMKEVCGVNSTYIPGGQSKSLATGGFNILLTGYANYGSANLFGYTANLCSSSSYNSNGAGYRFLNYGDASVGRSNYNRFYLFSVRCKKD